MGAEGFRFSQALGSALEARAYFLFDGKKKVAKEKATPGSAPLRGSLRYSADRAACLNSPAAQTRQADCPRPACVAQRLPRGPKNGVAQRILEKFACCGPQPKKGKNQIHNPILTPDALLLPLTRGRPGGGLLSGPLGRCRATQAGADKGRALFEGRSPELRSPRVSRVAQGTGAAGTDPGSPFLCLLSFGEAKESKTPRKGGTPCQKMPPSKEQQEC